MKRSYDDALSFLSGHLPGPPATVLNASPESRYCVEYLTQHRYEIRSLSHIEDILKARGRDGSVFNKEVPEDGDGEEKTGRYDVILFDQSLRALDGLERLVKEARKLLRPKGSVVVYDETDGYPNEGARSLTQDIVALFCENGFRVSLYPGQPPINPLNPSSKEADQTRDRAGHTIIVAKEDDFFIRAYDDGDEKDILQSFNTIFNTNRGIEHWQWKYGDNPFGRHKIAVAISKDGVLAAHYSGYPVPFYSSVGETGKFFSYQIGDIMTDPRFRRVGLGSSSVLSRTATYFYNRFCIGSIPFMYGFVAGNHRKFGERFLGYQYMPYIPYLVMDLPGPDLRLPRRIKALLSGLSVEKVSNVGLEYDSLFNRVCRDYGMLVKRDAAYLKWRYLDCPDKVHDLFALRRFGRLVGWSVFSVRGNQLLWGDALFEKRFAHNIDFLLQGLLQRFYRNIVRIEGWFSPTPGWWTAILQANGFELRKEPNDLVSGVALFDSSFSLNSVEHNFYYTMGDSDLF